jgi:hypothetical protein
MKTIIEIIIALFLAYLTWQNYGINKFNSRIQSNKLRLDLFDRRYKVFQALRDLLTVFISNTNFTIKEINQFINNSSDTEFLFGEDIKNYVDEIKKKSIKLRNLNEALERGFREDEKDKKLKELEELEAWFMDQVKESNKLFKKYLHFSIDNKKMSIYNITEGQLRVIWYVQILSILIIYGLIFLPFMIFYYLGWLNHNKKESFKFLPFLIGKKQK